MKGPTGKPFDGIYCNPRFIHSAASLVGSVVNIQVKNGSVYEGVFKTFSHKVDFVLEMVHKVEFKKASIAGSSISDINPKDVTDKMIFRIGDVVMLSAPNVDLEYASRETFTDTAISKFNGQVQERELEPWDGGLSSNEVVTELGEVDGDVSNGWDAAEMFRTNEEKYGVKSSFDSNLHDYTIPLKKQNTEEYKIQEAKASKIAQEIESSSHYKNRIALENGDEEERYSAVVRPENAANNTNNNNRFTVHRGARKMPMVRPVRSSPSPTAYPSNRNNSHPQNYHKMSTPNTLANNSQGKMANTKSVPTGIQSPSPKPVSSPSLMSRQPSTSPSQATMPTHPASPQQYPPNSNRNTGNLSSAPPPQTMENRKLNEDTPRTTKESLSKEANNAEPPHKNPERAKEISEKKPTGKKPPHDDKTEDLKRFHEKFKLPEVKEIKENRKEPVLKKSDSKSSDSSLDAKAPLEQKSKDDKDEDSSPEASIPDSSKNSKLNPNAKEFVLNPNAKSFTPRAVPMPPNVLPPPPQPPQPPVQQPPPRLHNQSPVIAVPQPVMTGMPHPVFTNMTQHYVLPGTPVTVSTPYSPATTIAQPPRFRKEFLVHSALPALPRNDSSQSIHVQAATGQPILAPTLPAQPFAIQYSPGILHPSGPPQPPLAYTQMYQMVGPRVLAPQPLGMVSAPGSYGENPHVPTPIFMNPQAVTGVQHPGGPSNSGQHSTSSTPQSQTPSLHPAPSPVHQQPPPPPAPPHGQPPTPTGHPGNPPTPQLIYHSQLTHHSLHPAATGHGHPYSQPMYSTTPQPIIMLPPQQPGGHPPHPPTYQTLQGHYHHAQTPGPHGGTPNQILPHPPVSLMPTSTAMGHGQVPVSNSPYVPHS